MSWQSGEDICKSARMRRLSQSIPTSYTLWKDTSTSPAIYRAETNIAGALDYPHETFATVWGQVMDALTTTGGALLIRDGSHDVASQCVHKENVRVIGESMDKTILNSTITNGDSVFKSDSTDDVSAISDISFENLKICGNGGEGHGVEWIWAPTCKLTNVMVDGVGGSGFHIHHCWGGKAYNLRADNCQDGIELQDRNHGFDLISCQANNNTRYGIHFNEDGQGAGANIKMLGGYSQNSGTNDIRVNGARSITLVTSCENNHAGINVIELLGPSTAVNITGSYIHVSGNTAIEIGNAWHVRIHGNRIIGSGSETAINFTDGRFISVYDNRYEGIGTTFNGSPTRYYSRDFDEVGPLKLTDTVNVNNQLLDNVRDIYAGTTAAIRIFTEDSNHVDTQRMWIGMGDEAVVNITGNTTFRVPARSSDPNTTGWDADYKGRSWFNTTSNVWKYWDGTAVKTIATV